MEKNTVKGLLIFILCVMGVVVATEGGRDVPVKDEVYSPQHFIGGLPFGFGLNPFDFPFFKPGLGGLPFGFGLNPFVFPFFTPGFGHFPRLAALPKDDAGLTDLPKGYDNNQVRSP